jgi:hypothetical protein
VGIPKASATGNHNGDILKDLKIYDQPAKHYSLDKKTETHIDDTRSKVHSRGG